MLFGCQCSKHNPLTLINNFECYLVDDNLNRKGNWWEKKNEKREGLPNIIQQDWGFIYWNEFQDKPCCAKLFYMRKIKLVDKKRSWTSTLNDTSC